MGNAKKWSSVISPLNPQPRYQDQSTAVNVFIAAHTESGGLLGEDRVNVFLLNLGLDQRP